MDIMTVPEYCKVRKIIPEPVKRALKAGRIPMGVLMVLHTFGGITLLLVNDAEKLPLTKKRGRTRGNPNFHLLSPYSKANKAKGADKAEDSETE